MSRPVVHLRAIYYRPSWQGPDLVLPRCRMGATGFICDPGEDFRLADDRRDVSCVMCLSPPRAIAREKPRSVKAPKPEPRPPVPAIIAPPATPSMDILREVAERAGLTVTDLKSAAKVRKIAHARQAAMWELRKRTRLSLVQIAQRVGRTNHATALYGIREHEKRMQQG